MSNSIANTVTTNILPVQALYDPTTLAFITFIGPAGTPFTGSGGGVSSVNVSGGTTGLTTSGGPIVSSGTITIAGTLNVANGGTGSTTANGALTNLLPSQTGNSGKFLTTDGTNTSWSTAGSGLTISTDTTTNASRYLTFTATTSGVITSENVSTSLYFNPSSGSLTATTFVGALTGNASTATSATISTNLAGGAAGSLPYQSGSSTTTFLAAGSNGQYLTLSGGVPTWANLTYVSSFSGGTTGLTPNTATTGAVTLAGTLAVANGGTGVTSSSGASSVVLRDANANITANNNFFGFTNVAAAGTTTTLTAASTPNFVVTGSGGQTYKLPDATTLPIGAIFTFNNNQTSGSVIVQNNSSTTIVTIPSGGYTTIILLSNSVAAGTWDYHFDAPSNVSWSTNTLSYAGAITNATWNGVAIGAIYGGTGQTSYTTGDTLYASASNTLSKLAIGSTGQVLTVAGGVPTWANTTAATTITDDTTTNATRYINFTSATSGSLSTIYTSSTKLQYNPSTGAFTAPTLTPANALGTAYGGTGLTSFTANGVVYASSTSALATAAGLTWNPSTALLGFQNAAANGYAYITNAGAGTNTDLAFYMGASEKMRLNTSGYLGIGTSSPSSTLTVSSSGSSIELKQNSTGNATYYVMDNTIETGGKRWRFGYTGASGIPTFSLYNQTDNVLSWVSDASGNLGLGVTPSAWGSSYKTLAISTESNFYASANQGGITLNAYNDNTNWKYTTSDYATRYLQYQGAHYWNIAGSGTAGNTISFTQAMTLDNSGRLLVGTTSYNKGFINTTANSTNQGIAINGFGTGINSGLLMETTVGGSAVVFNYSGTQVGSISLASSSTAYNTSSDYRLKENVKPMTGALATVAQLKPVTFDWIATKQSDNGFIAHELQAVLPNAVHGEKDAIDKDGNPVYQGIDTSFLVATLTSAIQELNAEIQSLKAEVATLKGA